ncbi:MAG: hypothetical protein QM500_03590 [Methylococcales bacterium]
MIGKHRIFTIPDERDIEEAEIDGYEDGFIGKDECSSKYSGRDVLFSAYIRAKSQGATERVKAKNREIKKRFKDDENG